MGIHTQIAEEGEVGKKFTELSMCAVNGQLNAITVEPATLEDIQHEFFEGAIVRVQFADRACWMEPRQIEDLIGALELSLRIGLQRWHRSGID